MNGYAWAENDTRTQNDISAQAEDEEIIGGIGGTGLHDMERPEMLERPEIEIDSVLESAIDADVDMSQEIEVDAEIPQ